MAVEFDPMRSFIYVDVVNEEYRHKLHHWLYYHHIPESMAQFQPYCTKYAFYNALPTPEDGEKFGTVRMQLTEHHWLVNIMDPALKVKAFQEYTPIEVLKWQGTVPETVSDVMLTGDEGRSTGGKNGCPPFVFAFCPMWWEEDIKGTDRMMEDGPNYRWNFAISYPEGVSMEEGDKWLHEEVFPHFAQNPCCTRILTSKVRQNINNCPMQRIVEMWFSGPAAWHRMAVDSAQEIKKPYWAKDGDKFPYLKAGFEIRGIFITDDATCDAYGQYRGFIPRR